jgi:hypothetical protein
MATKTAAAKKPAAKTKTATKPAAKAVLKKAAAPKAAAKPQPAKASAVKKPAPKPVAVKPLPKPAPAKAVAAKPAAKPAIAPVKPQPSKVEAKAPLKPAAAPAPVKAQPAKAAPLAVKAVEVKKIAGLKAASQGRGVSFDPDKRRELIAAAAARHNKAAPAKFAGPRIDPIVVREPAPVERHRFSVGDPVKVVSTSGMWFKHGVAYKVTAALPPAAGGKLQYRIKNDQEPFERVVSESQLASL